MYLPNKSLLCVPDPPAKIMPFITSIPPSLIISQTVSHVLPKLFGH